MQKNTTPPGKAKPNPKLQDLWDASLDTYAGHPGTALVMAQNFHALIETLKSGPSASAEIIRALESGIDHLFVHSSFYAASRQLFDLAVAGNLKPEYELTTIADKAQQAATESKRQKGSTR